MEWISVKDRLPECPESKPGDLGWLVFTPRHRHKINVSFQHPSWWSSDEGYSDEITHWMPLPSPPVVTPE